MPFLLQRVASGFRPDTQRPGPPERHRPAPGCAADRRWCGPDSRAVRLSVAEPLAVRDNTPAGMRKRDPLSGPVYILVELTGFEPVAS